MTLTWTKILLGALIAYVVYKTFISKEGMSSGQSIAGYSIISIFSVIIVATIVYLLYDYFVTKKMIY